MFNEFELSHAQRKTIATALTLISCVIIVLLCIATLIGLIRFVDYFSGVFFPLATAGIAALVMKPYYEWMERNVNNSRTKAIIYVYASILVPVICVGWFFGAIILEQLISLVTGFPTYMESLRKLVSERSPELMAFLEKYDLITTAREFLQGQTGAISRSFQRVGGEIFSIGAVMFRTGASLLNWFVLPVYLTFFLIIDPIPSDKLEKIALPFLKEDKRKDVGFLVSEFIKILVAFFRGQLLIALCQGVLLAILFMLIGVKYGFLLGLILGLLNIVPYLGSMIGLGVILPLAWFQPGGGLTMVIGVIISFTVVQMIEAYVLTPKIMGDTTGLHPLAIIFAIFFWGTAFGGITGMLMAIPLTAFFVVFWRLLREKYIREIL
jgi:predicted PurR-regulated permease PerM